MEKFDRFKLLIGDDYNKIVDKTVLVIGLGGVGGYAVEALVRSGIRNLIIVDNDTIDITNLNRQLITNINNINEKKTTECKKRIESINNDCNVIVINEFITEDNIYKLFENSVDYIVDCCDTIKTKIAIIKSCINKNVKFISCMGTGNKMDPSKLKIVDLKSTNYDPVARLIRKVIKEEKINKKIMVVSSDEPPYTKFDKVIPSNSFVPSVAGMLCASYVINDIIK